MAISLSTRHGRKDKGTDLLDAKQAWRQDSEPHRAPSQHGVWIGDRIGLRDNKVRPSHRRQDRNRRNELHGHWTRSRQREKNGDLLRSHFSTPTKMADEEERSGSMMDPLTQWVDLVGGTLSAVTKRVAFVVLCILAASLSIALLVALCLGLGSLTYGFVVPLSGPVFSLRR